MDKSGSGLVENIIILVFVLSLTVGILVVFVPISIFTGKSSLRLEKDESKT